MCSPEGNEAYCMMLADHPPPILGLKKNASKKNKKKKNKKKPKPLPRVLRSKRRFRYSDSKLIILSVTASLSLLFLVLWRRLLNKLKRLEKESEDFNGATIQQGNGHND